MKFSKVWKAAFKYAGGIVSTLEVVAEAREDGVYTPDELVKIAHTAIKAADIPGVNADLITVTLREDGGFQVDFPKEAVKDWSFRKLF